MYCAISVHLVRSKVLRFGPYRMSASPQASRTSYAQYINRNSLVIYRPFPAFRSRSIPHQVREKHGTWRLPSNEEEARNRSKRNPRRCPQKAFDPGISSPEAQTTAGRAAENIRQVADALRAPGSVATVQADAARYLSALRTASKEITNERERQVAVGASGRPDACFASVDPTRPGTAADGKAEGDETSRPVLEDIFLGARDLTERDASMMLKRPSYVSMKSAASFRSAEENEGRCGSLELDMSDLEKADDEEGSETDDLEEFFDAISPDDQAAGNRGDVSVHTSSSGRRIHCLPKAAGTVRESFNEVDEGYHKPVP